MADRERFLRDVADHKLRVVRAYGLFRHLAFRAPDRREYWFELITWPGALCIRGDCGTYVFSRLEDMFDFFRSPTGAINPGYWAEKCDSDDVSDGIREFDPKLFNRRVVQLFRDHWRDQDKGKQLACFKVLRADVLDHVDIGTAEHDAYGLLGSFKYCGFEFEDYWEIRANRYTFRFLWCLHAIVWGIQQYDDAQARACAILGLPTGQVAEARNG